MSKSISEMDKVYTEMWNEVLLKLDRKTSIFQNFDNSKTKNFITSGENYCFYTLDARHKKVIVKLDFRKSDAIWNIDVLNKMKIHKNEIESLFGRSLLWHQKDGKDITWIGVQKEGFDIHDKESRKRMIEYMVENITKLENATRNVLIAVKKNLL